MVSSSKGVMARTKAVDVGNGVESSHEESEKDSDSESADSSISLDEEAARAGLDNAEPEYHTEESDISDADNEDYLSDIEHLNDDVDAAGSAAAPLLPAELLKPLPSPAYSLWDGINIPWNQMTPEQKRAERLRSRRAAKREWDTFNRTSNGMREVAKRNGVLDAGKAAQLRRKTTKARGKTVSGRVKKPVLPQVSGREKLLHRRRGLVERNDQLLKRSKKTKKALPKR